MPKSILYNILQRHGYPSSHILKTDAAGRNYYLLNVPALTGQTLTLTQVPSSLVSAHFTIYENCSQHARVAEFAEIHFTLTARVNTLNVKIHLYLSSSGKIISHNAKDGLKNNVLLSDQDLAQISYSAEPEIKKLLSTFRQTKSSLVKEHNKNLHSLLEAVKKSNPFRSSTPDAALFDDKKSSALSSHLVNIETLVQFLQDNLYLFPDDSQNHSYLKYFTYLQKNIRDHLSKNTALATPIEEDEASDAAETTDVVMVDQLLSQDNLAHENAAAKKREHQKKLLKDINQALAAARENPNFNLGRLAKHGSVTSMIELHKLYKQKFNLLEPNEVNLDDILLMIEIEKMCAAKLEILIKSGSQEELFKLLEWEDGKKYLNLNTATISELIDNQDIPSTQKNTIIIELVKYFDISSEDRCCDRKNWLIAAFLNNNLELFTALLDLGSSPNMYCSTGTSLLEHCLAKNRLDYAKALIRHNALISHIPSRITIEAPVAKKLASPFFNPSAKTKQVSHSQGKDIETKSLPILLIACFFRQFEIIELLIEKSCDVLEKSKDGYTALDLLLRSDQDIRKEEISHFVHVVKLLLAQGCCLASYIEKYGCPLLRATDHRHSNLVAAWLQLGFRSDQISCYFFAHEDKDGKEVATLVHASLAELAVVGGGGNIDIFSQHLRQIRPNSVIHCVEAAKAIVQIDPEPDHPELYSIYLFDLKNRWGYIWYARVNDKPALDHIIALVLGQLNDGVAIIDILESINSEFDQFELSVPRSAAVESLEKARHLAEQFKIGAGFGDRAGAAILAGKIDTAKKIVDYCEEKRILLSINEPFLFPKLMLKPLSAEYTLEMHAQAFIFMHKRLGFCVNEFINRQNPSVLWLACRTRNKLLFDYLLANGADINLPCKGQTLYAYCRSNGLPDYAEKLRGVAKLKNCAKLAP